MTTKMAAAHHEAGHAAIAKGSKFHEVVSGIDLADYGAGVIDVSLSKSKLNAAGNLRATRMRLSDPDSRKALLTRVSLLSGDGGRSRARTCDPLIKRHLPAIATAKSAPVERGFPLVRTAVPNGQRRELKCDSQAC